MELIRPRFVIESAERRRLVRRMVLMVMVLGGKKLGLKGNLDRRKLQKEEGIYNICFFECA